ncbi:MAG: sulfite exporter TauE/SafE family protein [Afipia sp.]|nr:sulfite exporter TauE/SafE family protein [Afipia sp.]
MELIVLAAIATVIAGIIRTSVGVGAGIGLTASLLLLFNTQTTLAIMAFLQIVFGISALVHYWRKWETALVIQLLTTAILGVGVGTALISVLPIDIVKRILGFLIAACGLIELLKLWIGSERVAIWARNGWIVGFSGGLAGGLVNASGAVLALYLKGRGLTHGAYLGTLSAVVLGHDAFRLALYWALGLLSTSAFLIAAILTPFAIIGGWMGVYLQSVVPERTLSLIVLGLVVVLGIILVL